MKTIISTAGVLVGFICLTACLLTHSAAAADRTKTPEEQTWIEFDVAGFLMQDTDLREFLGPWLPAQG